MSGLVDESGVEAYPAWETPPLERLSPRSDTVGRRLAVMRRLAHPSGAKGPAAELLVVVTPVRSLLQPQVKGLAELEVRHRQRARAEDRIRGLKEHRDAEPALPRLRPEPDLA